MNNITYEIAKRFTKYPGPRYIEEGEYSGELFRKTELMPTIIEAKKNNHKIILNLDGTSGYGTSFIEEVFGGLIREEKMSIKEIYSIFTFISKEDENLIDDITEYMEEAEKNSKRR